MSGSEQSDGVRPELVERFPRQFAACWALQDFARANRPAGPPTPDEAGHIILWTYARSTKTFQGSLRLCAAGYGEQAGMLNRSLYEDMLIAHWVKRHPAEAPRRLHEHETYVLARWGAMLKRHDLLAPGVVYPTLAGPQKRALGSRYRGKTWTGLNLPELLADVRGDWPSEDDRRHLTQVHDVVHGFNNTLLHHGGLALTTIGTRHSETGAVTFNIGPSETHIWGALFGAFFTYANTASLVYLDDDAIGKVYREHMRAFAAS